MFNVVHEYFLVFLIVTLLLFVGTIIIRFTSARSKKDKVIYTGYSAVLGVFLVLLVVSNFM